jgi:ubiquinone/menaquinone biosynthesis C-methylase UbiE
VKRVTDNIQTAFPHVERAKYDFRARKYEWLVASNWFNILHWNTQPKYYTAFAKEAILENIGKLIDIGCGGLSQTYALYQQTDNDCTLIDRSIEMLKVAEQRLMNSENCIPSNIHLLQGDAFKLPFAENSFDILCSFGTLHLFDDKKYFVENILKVLKPNGKFYFLVMTNQYLNSRIFMNVLSWFGEFRKICSAKQLLSIFPTEKYRTESYMKGSVLFIKGKKIG